MKQRLADQGYPARAECCKRRGSLPRRSGAALL
jgi:hypothetical protein